MRQFVARPLPLLLDGGDGLGEHAEAALLAIIAAQEQRLPVVALEDAAIDEHRLLGHLVGVEAEVLPGGEHDRLAGEPLEAAAVAVDVEVEETLGAAADMDRGRALGIDPDE